MHDLIAISDIHLGTDVCCAKQLSHFLEKIDNKEILTKKLILNGDVFDSHDFRRLKKTHWKILSLLRKLSDDIEIIWVAGNHDGPAEIISHLIGVDVVEEYVTTIKDKKILFLHGDRYDDFIAKHPIVTKIADWIYYWIQKFDKEHNFCKWLKHQSKTYVRCSEQIELQSLKYAKKIHANVVVTGHTHSAIIKTLNDITYVNLGCWTEKPPTYLTITNQNVNLNDYHEEKI